jgi:RES domain-containing protein
VTITAWRLVKWKHVDDAFSGEGSSLYGGRWSSPGRRVVYVSESQALCALETIVHFPPGRTPPAYGFISVTFDSALVRPVPFKLIPDWAARPAWTAAIGDRWLADSQSSCILAVPTALVPEGTNYLINPAHADFAKLSIRPYASRFNFDLRMVEPFVPAAL